MKLLDYIGSRRFAIILMMVTLAAILMLNLLPNFSVMKREDLEALKRVRPAFYRVVSLLQIGSAVKTPFFLFLPAFIFTSITVCTLKRVKREEWRRRGVTIGEIRHRVDFPGEIGFIDDLLRKRGWATEISGEPGIETVAGVKGRKGFWGSVLFHAGMNVALIGVALSLFTRFNGNLVLTDGYGAVLPNDFIGERPSSIPVTGALMEGFRAEYMEGFPVDYSMDLTLWTDFKERKRRVRVNEPLSWMGYQFAPMRYGFSPNFVLKKEGRTILDTYVNLVVMTPEQTDSFEVREEGMKISARFFPDFFMEGKKPGTRSREPKNPVFFIEASKGKDILHRGFLPMKKETAFSGYSIECREIRMWVMFSVSRDFGLPPITFGFILIMTGLIIRFVWNERAVWFILKDGAVEIGGRARYFPSLFDEELKRMAEELRHTGRGDS